MATRSKNTDLFRGVISWLCMILVLCSITTGIAALVVTAVRIAKYGGSMDYFTNFSLDFFTEPNLFRFFDLLPYSDNFLLPMLTVLLLFVAAVTLAFLFRADRRAFEASIARGLGKIWVEIKICAIILLSLLVVLAALSMPQWIGLAVLCCTPVLLLYFLCLDIGHNRTFFRHNIIHSILEKVNSYKGMSTFQQRSLRRVYSCLGIICGVLLLGVLILAFLNSTLGQYPLLWLLLLGFTAVSIVGTICWYILALKQDLRDWNVLIAQIAEMYGGNLNAVNHVPPTSNLYDCAMQLNMIRTGIQKAVEEGIKADRTKVELITNVSHDIKTPLTSIISYIELLKKEPDLPPHVMDYVTTISRKADRLNHIVQDVFEISKAATGNITLHMEDLDIGKLLHQTFGEMDETLRNSQLNWRVDIPDTPVLVHADGQRLYRVFQNLIRNCDQYSLEGSRVYVSLIAQNGFAQVTIRNISKNEIAMNGEDLTARFVRGDQNRTTEGSGLGLSIAKSFTEACGGRFTVNTDGDLFIAAVQFPLAAKDPPAAPVPPNIVSIPSRPSTFAQ